jgi:hypothetical protein
VQGSFQIYKQEREGVIEVFHATLERTFSRIHRWEGMCDLANQKMLHDFAWIHANGAS